MQKVKSIAELQAKDHFTFYFRVRVMLIIGGATVTEM